MKNIRISLVIPAYNRENLIRETIESALDQTEKIDEIIIIDNDSSDKTFEIAQDYARMHDNVQAFKNEKNVGMMENWNRGIRKTTGEYVSLLHSDDIIPKNWCATVKASIQKDSKREIGLFFGIYACFEKKGDKKRIVSRVKNFSKDTFLAAKESLRRLWKNYYGNPNCSASIIYKREIFDVVGYFDPSRGTEADQHFHIKVLNVFDSYFIAQDLLYYRRHELQAFDFKQEVESADTVVKRLLNAIRIQKELLDPELVKYTYCGVLLYGVKFILSGKFNHARAVFQIPGIFNVKTLIHFPRFFMMLLYRKYSSNTVNFLRKFGVPIGFFLFAVIVLRHLLFREYESIGHNWDWGFPALPYMFERIRELSAYAWSPIGLGKSLNLQAHIIVNEPISFLGTVFGVKNSILILFLSVFALSFFSFKKLLDFIGTEKSLLNYLPSILYAFSPFLFNEIIGGSWYMWISYAFAPLLFLYLVNYVRHKKTSSLIGYLIASSFVIISLQNFVTIEFIAVVFMILSLLFERDGIRVFTYQTGRYLLAHILLILISLYWIIPFIDSLGAFYSMVTNVSFTGGFEGVRNITQSILHIFLMTGYLDRNMYFYAVPDFLSSLSVSVISFFWMLVFSVYIFGNEEKLRPFKKDVLLWSLILVVFTLVVKGGNEPFSSFTMGIFKHFPLMSLYRSPQHLMLVAAFVIPLLSFFVIRYYLARNVSKKIVVSVGLVIAFFWTSSWWYGGDLGSMVLREENRDHIDLYSTSPDLRKVYDYNEKSALFHRILFLPTSFSPDFLPNDYQNKGQGGQSEYTHLKNPTFNWEFNDIAKRIDDKFCYQEDFNFLNYLSLTNTRYIYLREDIYPHHSECGIFKVWDIKKVEEAVRATPGLTPIEVIDGLYRVDDEYFSQHVFIPDRTIVSDRDPEQLPEIVSENFQPGTSIFFEKQNPGKSEEFWRVLKSYTKPSEFLESLEFRRVNPTRYQVHVKNAKEVFPLILSEGFHEGWRVYPSRVESASLERQKFISRSIHGSVQNDNLSSGRLWETWFLKPSLEESSHLLVNGYANSWLIDPKEFCLESPESCLKKENGAYDIVLVLEFWPQRLMYLGGAVTAVLLFVGGVVWGISGFRKQRARKSQQIAYQGDK